MKYSAVIAAFLGTAQAGPPAYNEPPFAVSTHPSAAGLVQKKFATGMNGDEDLGEDITMKGNKFHFNQNLAQARFATGMNGDEDLGEDITMKGNKFHFNQNLAQARFATGMNGDEDLGEDITMKGNKFHFNQNLAQARFATGMNGDEDLGEDITMKGNKFHFNQNLAQARFATGMNGDEDLGEDITMKGNKFHFNQNLAQARFATGMNGDEDLGEDITMKGNKFHFNQALAQGEGEGKIPKADWTGYTVPDKVHTLDPKSAKTHTGFYAQFATGMNGDEDLGEDITMKGNKFHFNQALAQGDVVPYAKQIAEGPAPAAPFKADWEGYTFPDKMHTLDPKAAKTNTGFYAQQ